MEFKVKPEVAAIEDALIVSLWHDPNLLGVVPHLTERHFPTWGVVFKHIKDAFLNGYRPIVSLLPTTLQFPFAELLDKTPPMDEAEVKVAAEQLVKQQTLSLLKRLGEMVVRKASDGVDPSYLIGVISHYLEQTVKGMGLELKPFPTLIEGYLKWLTGAEQDANVVGSFGLPTLDEKIGQLRAGMLVTVLAPTGGGKTSFAVQTALNSALNNHPVAFFSLEMTEEQLMTRMVAHLTSLPSFALWTRRIGSSPEDLKKIEDLRDMGLPIYLARDTWTLDDVLRAIVTAKLRFGCRLVIIDYLQKIIAPQQERRELEVAMVAKELKRYALQQEVAVIALSQVNTEREGRARESRVIEHESDVMLFLKASEFGRVKIEVRKNRMGESGHIIEADFNAELCRFSEVAPEGKDEQVIGYKRLEEAIGKEAAKLVTNIVSPRESDNGRQPIRLLTLSEWDEQLAHLSQGSWFVEGLLRAGWLLVITARPKVGKSIVAVNLALALAEGKPFLNLPTSPCAVLYIDLERPLETRNRFKTLGAIGNPNIFVPEERIDADKLDTLRELIRQVQERTNRPVVVVIDTLGDFIKPALRQRKASINDYDPIAEILQDLRDLALELGCAFVFTHHARKALAEEANEVDVLGSTAIAGKFDVLVHLQRANPATLRLIAEGNAILKTQLTFTIRDFQLERVEPPARTKKEEQAASFLYEKLAGYPEGLSYGEMVKLVLEEKLAEREGAAKRLVDRALRRLMGQVQAERSGRTTIYRLRAHPSAESAPAGG
ncbi:MAG: DnaB-like helicase C-terminal domain-containing protein [Armatimonadota bacterium]